VRPLRVALVHPYSWPEVRRGGERYLADLSWYLAGAGHLVEVITGTEGATADERVDQVMIHRRHHILQHRFAGRGIGATETFALPALSCLLRRRYDVVHALTPTAAIAARLAGQRTVLTLLGHPTEDALGQRPGLRRLLKIALRAAHVVTVLSRASAAEAERVLGTKAVVLPPGVRLDRFPPSLRPRSGPPRILFSADLNLRQKGLDTLLAATPTLLERRPDLRIQLSGDGDPSWALEGLGSDRSRVTEALDHLGVGALDEVPRRYAGASATVLPSTHEAFGLALLESLASGTPVVCSQEGGMPEIVDDPVVGRTAPYGRPDALADAIDAVLTLAGSDDVPKRCRAHARRWDWQDMVGPAHERLYRRVAAGTGVASETTDGIDKFVEA